MTQTLFIAIAICVAMLFGVTALMISQAQKNKKKDGDADD